MINESNERYQSLTFAPFAIISTNRHSISRGQMIVIVYIESLKKKEEKKTKGEFEIFFSNPPFPSESNSLIYFCSGAAFSSLLISNFDLISLMK
jgi:hypothetical protein